MTHPLRLWRAVFLISLLFLPIISRGQSAVSGDEAKVVALLSVDKLAPGVSFRIAVVVDLKEPWHINANNVSTEGLIPTTLTFQPPSSIVIDRITYPPGERTKVGWADKPVALYTGRALIFVDSHAKADAKPGPLKLEGSLRYQACNDRVCIAPKTVPIVIETAIAEPGSKSLPVHPEIFSAATEAAPPAPQVEVRQQNPDSSLATFVSERGWFITFVFVFLGGLALNLTPCVFPMIAITVSYFGGSGEKRLVHALVYFLGIVLTYSSLGLAAALTGGLFGAALQSPWVLAGVAALLVGLALSMFGLYELQPPQFLMQKAAGLSSKAGVAGVFLLGATVGIIAAPCVGPIIVGVFVFVAQRADPWLGWWMFFTLACGLGLPYVILGAFSGLLTKLPKSGNWMVWVKRVFGVALLVVAAWFVKPIFGARTDAKSPINWQPYSAGLLTGASQPLLLDFYADWCIPCHEMDNKTYSDPRVIEKAKQFVMVKVDLTKQGVAPVDELVRKYSIVGMPTTAFLAPGGREHGDLRQVGFVNADKLLNSMAAALTTPAPTNAAAGMSDVPPQLLNPF
jgi:thioredoxin:protein disulfide reductase